MVVRVCGRYQFTAEQSAEILRIVQMVQEKYGGDAWRPGEVRPTAMAPVLVSKAGEAVPELYRWGYRLPGSLVINARAESVEEKPMFRRSMDNGRCVVPSTGFFEWDSEKRKYLFTMPDSDALYMAGLWAVRDGQPCYCIVTTKANDSMGGVHPRMPLVLEQKQVRLWLEDTDAARELLRQTPPMLERVSADAQLRLW